MLVRLWQVAIADGQAAALERFAHDISLPMLRAQPGCLGVLFSRTATLCTTITFWTDRAAIERAEAARDYQAVVARIEAAGLIGAHHGTAVFDIFGGHLDPQLTARLSGP